MQNEPINLHIQKQKNGKKYQQHMDVRFNSFLADCEHPWKDINRNESDDHDPLFHCCPPLCFSFSHDLTKCNFVELKRNTSSSKLLPMFHNDYCLEYNRNSFPRFDHSCTLELYEDEKNEKRNQSNH
ncbi:hypothetical protein BLOT_000240 [Blomia tropicalis]|nr:hypothetical protein BLOT_000240 [Blomia tropicalis]